MIFVSVGTHKQPFDRLLVKLDELIEKKIIKEKVFAQIGETKYKPKNYSAKKFLSLEEFDQKIKNCSFFITHSGEGNIGTGLQFEKKMIVVPRLKCYGEHTNNHQLELAEAIKKEKQAIICYVDDLELVLKEVKKIKIKTTNHAAGIIHIIEKKITEWKK